MSFTESGSAGRARRVAGLRDSAVQSVRAGVHAGAFQYVAALLSVQGLSYLTQLSVARLVGPADFAVVRSVESTLNVLLVVASLGMPMLAVTLVAGLTEEADQGRVLGTLLSISLCGGLAVALVASLGAGLAASSTPAYLRMMSGTLVLTAASRTCLNYFQGRREVRRVATLSVALSFLSLIAVVAFVRGAGLSGWVAGRFVGEACFLAMLIRAVGPTLSLRGPIPGGRTVRGMLASGSGIAGSLLVRTATDNVGIFLLTAAGASRAAIGYFGLDSLILVGVLLVPGALSSLALPRVVGLLRDHSALMALMRRVTVVSIMLSIIIASVTALLARPLIGLMLPSYVPAIPVLWLLLIAVPFRMLSSLSGTVLVACDRVPLTIVSNCIALVATLIVGFSLAQRWGASGVATGVIVGEAAGALAYAIWAVRSLSQLPSSPNFPMRTT